MFRIGQKVVCVDDEAEGWGPLYPVRKNEVYTVRALGRTTRDAAGLRLFEVELTSPPFRVGVSTGKPFVDNFFRASRFRPLTDISIFQEILHRVSRKQGVDA